MIKRRLTLVVAVQYTVLPHITASMFVNGAAGQRPVAQPHRRGRLSERHDRMADAHLKRHGAPSAAVVVAVTSGRLDGFAVLTRTFGTWERILCQLDG